MEDKNVLIPYIAYESELSRQERTIKRLWVLCIILILVSVASNAGWIWYESQFEDVVTTSSQEITQDVTQDSGDGGYNNFVGRDYYNGYTESETNS